MATELIVPTVHLNGTGRKELVNQLSASVLALDKALEVMAKAAPHGRDYYPQDNGAIMGPTYLKAAEAHRQRVAKVYEVREELHDLAFSLVHDQ